MYMTRLTLRDIENYTTSAEPLPLQRPLLEDQDPLSCRVCLRFKGAAIVTHLVCSNPICCTCSITLVKERLPCPTCRRPLVDGNGPTWVTRPSPLLQQIIGNVKYKCDNCQLIMNSHQARSHPTNCAAVERRDLPAYVPPRGDGDFVMKELVSNPPVEDSDRPEPTSFKRLIIQHHNGLQKVSRMVSIGKTVGWWRREVAEVTGVDPRTIRMFKFMHRELKDWDSIENVCPTRGATWLMSWDTTTGSFEQFDQLHRSSAFLSICEAGHPPRLEPRPVEPEPWPEVVELEQEEEW